MEWIALILAMFGMLSESAPATTSQNTTDGNMWSDKNAQDSYLMLGAGIGFMVLLMLCRCGWTWTCTKDEPIYGDNVYVNFDPVPPYVESDPNAPPPYTEVIGNE